MDLRFLSAHYIVYILMLFFNYFYVFCKFSVECFFSLRINVLWLLSFYFQDFLKNFNLGNILIKFYPWFLLLLFKWNFLVCGEFCICKQHLETISRCLIFSFVDFFCLQFFVRYLRFAVVDWNHHKTELKCFQIVQI